MSMLVRTFKQPEGVNNVMSVNSDDLHNLVEMVGACVVQHPAMFSFEPSKRPIILVEDNHRHDVPTLRSKCHTSL